MPSKLLAEDRIVAELSDLGIRYLSRVTDVRVDSFRPVEQLLADLVRQPSSRVRTATIALLLEHPEYAECIPTAIATLRGSNRIVLKLFYTAAVYLQRKYASILRGLQGYTFQWLPDFYSVELKIPPDLSLEESLKELGYCHQILTSQMANWAGTYENAAHQLIRYHRLERVWNL